MGYLLTFLAAVLLLLKPKNKLVTLVVFSLLVVIFGFNNHHIHELVNQDFSNYFTMFDRDSYNPARIIEPGFTYIINLFNSFNLNFTMFRVCIALVGYYLIINTLKLYTKWGNYVLLLYLIFPFINDVIQIRNFLAMSIFIFSTRYLVNKIKYAEVKYLALIAIATTIHVTYFVYFPLIFLRKINSNDLFKYIIVISGSLSALAYTGIFRYIASLATTNQKVLHYLERTTTWGMVVVLFFLFSFFYSYYIMHLRAKKNYNGFYFNDRINKVFKLDYINIILKINIYMLLLIPFLIYDFNYLRMYRNILILNYVVFIDAIMYTNNRAVRSKYILAAASFTILMFVFYYLIHYEQQIIPVIQDNYLFYF